jgi:hypothetical protein
LFVIFIVHFRDTYDEICDGEFISESITDIDKFGGNGRGACRGIAETAALKKWWARVCERAGIFFHSSNIPIPRRKKKLF